MTDQFSAAVSSSSVLSHDACQTVGVCLASLELVDYMTKVQYCTVASLGTRKQPVNVFVSQSLVKLCQLLVDVSWRFGLDESLCRQESGREPCWDAAALLLTVFIWFKNLRPWSRSHCLLQPDVILHFLLICFCSLWLNNSIRTGLTPVMKEGSWLVEDCLDVWTFLDLCLYVKFLFL